MIRIEAAQKILIGLPRPTGMLDRDHAGDETQHLSRTALRLKKNFFVRDELLGRCRRRFVTADSDFWDFEDILIRIMGL